VNAKKRGSLHWTNRGPTRPHTRWCVWWAAFCSCHGYKWCEKRDEPRPVGCRQTERCRRQISLHAAAKLCRGGPQRATHAQLREGGPPTNRQNDIQVCCHFFFSCVLFFLFFFLSPSPILATNLTSTFFFVTAPLQRGRHISLHYSQTRPFTFGGGAF